MVELFGLILIGAAIGLLAGIVVREKTFGHAANLAIGALGSVSGGCCLGLMSIYLRGMIGTLLAGAFGAIVLLTMVFWLRSWPAP